MSSIAVLCLAAYSNSLSGPFVFDDVPNIQDNRSLRWTDFSWSGVQGAVRESPSPSRPVANLSFALNYYFGQHNVRGYHVVNIGIHLLTALLVYLLALAVLRRVPPREDRLLRPSVSHWIALTAALIFASHPIQTQAVTYIVQRMTSLCAFFYLAALLLYIYGRTAQAPRRRWTLWASSVVCWLLALGSKQISVTLPVTILWFEWYFFQDSGVAGAKKNTKFGLLALALLGLLGLLAWLYLGSEPLDRLLASYAHRDFTLGQRLMTQFRVVMFYLSLLAVPHPSRLNLIHQVVPSQSPIEPITTLLSMVGISGLLGLTLYLAHRHRIASFCLLWFFLHLVIESSVIGLEMVFEHRLYLPMVGFSLLLAWLLFAGTGAPSGWAVAVPAAICLLLAVGSYHRNQVWQDEITLWSDVVSKSPQHARAHNNLGAALGRVGRFDAALTQVQEALQIEPDYAEAHYNWGVALAGLGRPEEAVAHYQKALRLEPDHAKAHDGWGTALQLLGRFEESVAHYEHALRIEPDYADAHYNWGTALANLGRSEEAIAHYRDALRNKTNLAEAHYNWALAVQDLGRLAEAMTHYQEALRIRPDYAEAQYNLGVLLEDRPRKAALQ